jgi:hypothetical protein
MVHTTHEQELRRGGTCETGSLLFLHPSKQFLCETDGVVEGERIGPLHVLVACVFAADYGSKGATHMVHTTHEQELRRGGTCETGGLLFLHPSKQFLCETDGVVEGERIGSLHVLVPCAFAADPRSKLKLAAIAVCVTPPLFKTLPLAAASLPINIPFGTHPPTGLNNNIDDCHRQKCLFQRAPS